MKTEQVRYFIAAISGENVSSVYADFMPDRPNVSTDDNIIGIFSGIEPNSVHTGVMQAEYQVIVRNATKSSAESIARLIADATHNKYGLSTYYGIKLTAGMNVSNPITFDPDDGAGGGKAAAFAVGDYIMIGDEVLIVTDVTAPTVTASRAALGTTVTTHSDNDAVYNISHDPVPSEEAGNVMNNQGIINMGVDTENRWEYSVNFTVGLKP